MFVVNYPLFLPVCRLIMDQSTKSCREKSPIFMVSAHYSLLLIKRVITYTTCYFLLVPDYMAETLELRRILISIE